MVGSEFERALRLMRRHDPQLVEGGFGWLREMAGAHVDDLIVEFGRETDHALRCWLLELIGETRSPRSFDLLVAQLQGEDELLRDWAGRGLRLLDTKEARRVLWQHKQNQPPEAAPVFGP
ncbi:HEAT repeat domain-containing protein [Salinispora tropica]|uniref:HEAT repeat domain-containing protein n=1 Tax=Salinispora tropica TaxID=168695 RepID=UPI00048BE9A7|nr:HEAT repeat domain-containing protein [Salinispora tropica]